MSERDEHVWPERIWLGLNAMFDVVTIDDPMEAESEDVEYIRADLAAEREQELLKKAAQCVPTTWLDPLLTGPNAVDTKGMDGREVERLLRGIQDRIRALAAYDEREGEP